MVKPKDNIYQPGGAQVEDSDIEEDSLSFDEYDYRSAPQEGHNEHMTYPQTGYDNYGASFQSGYDDYQAGPHAGHEYQEGVANGSVSEPPAYSLYFPQTERPDAGNFQMETVVEVEPPDANKGEKYGSSFEKPRPTSLWSEILANKSAAPKQKSTTPIKEFSKPEQAKSPEPVSLSTTHSSINTVTHGVPNAQSSINTVSCAVPNPHSSVNTGYGVATPNPSLPVVTLQRVERAPAGCSRLGARLICCVVFVVIIIIVAAVTGGRVWIIPYG